MLNSKKKPIFYSSERLAELAKIVSETSVDNISISSSLLNVTPDNQIHNRSTPINQLVDNTKNLQSHKMDTIISETNKSHLISDDTNKNNKDDIIPKIVSVTTDSNLLVQDNINSQNDYSEKKIMFTVISGGFHNGNFSEFKLNEQHFISKHNSKRGITVLCLFNDFKTYNAWNFDFYNDYTKVETNKNFISLLRRLPINTYFAMSIKDDAYKNLFEGTINFLSKIIGCKTIWRLNYRNSWCAIIYKKTEKLFKVISESHNPNGIAIAQCPIINKSTEFKTNNYDDQEETDFYEINSNNFCIKNTKDEKYNKLFEEIQSLKRLVSDQTKQIKKLIETKKDE